MYDHKSIEKKWQKKWEETGIYKTPESSDKPKYYVLDMFPYPSGAGLHVGHPKGYIATDVTARFKMMNGFNVLHPMGWDAFGLPAENYALEMKTHPRIAAEKNIKRFKKQLEILGLTYDWEREINTTDPNYYKWTQWIFLQMFKKGLAYESYEPINWCPSCKTGLANEDLEDGKCERCDSEIEQKPMRQWVLKITDYAEQLLDGLKDLDWEDSIIEMQKNWIGRSEGVMIKFKIPINGKNFVSLGFKTQANKITWFITFSTKKRIPVFETKDQCLTIVNSIFNSCLKHNFELHEISIVDDHVHIMVDTERNIPIEKIYKYLKGFSAKKFHEKFEPYWKLSWVLKPSLKGSHLWTPKGNYSIIENEKQYQDILKYIQQNPEKRKLSPKERLLSENLDKLYLELEVFTTRPDTLFGATYFVISPEHPLVEKITTSEQKKEVEKYIKKAANKSALERTELQKEKTGVFTGAYAKNPVNDEMIPVWIADYVMMGYGTGAIMAVPAHDERDFEFAKKHNIPIKCVIDPDISIFGAGILEDTIEDVKNETIKKMERVLNSEEPYIYSGTNINSKFLNGLETKKAKQKMIQWLEKKGLGQKTINYKLRDWVFSRQRYWGEPIPLIHCEKCGIVPVPEEELPIELPDVKHYEPTGTGESPLANIEEWVNTTCPKCGGTAKRETNTMPQWAGSCWYYLRYIDPKNDKKLIDSKKEKYWMAPARRSDSGGGVDLYVGGAEHATRHLIYARFWHKFLYEIGAVSTSEPFKKLQHVGLIQAEDGRKMSKRWNNVVNPDNIVEKYGADAMRVYEMFMGPFDQAIAWSTNNLIGSRKFLEKIWRLKERVVKNSKSQIANSKQIPNSHLESLLHKTIKKVTEDIENFKFNTAISALMILVNEMEKAESLFIIYYSLFIILLSPFAPHLTEELWEKLGNKDSVFRQDWPKYDEALIKDEEIELVIQINGKVRDKMTANADISEEEAKEKALASEKIQKWLKGKEPKKIIFVKGKLISIVI